jgi:drug/metabolite transporter (DMT)-like permease
LIAISLMGTVPMSVKGIAANPWTIGIVRLLIASLCAALFLRGSRDLFRYRKDFGPLALIGGAFALHWITYFISLKTTDASVAAIGTATYGVHVAFLGRIMLGQIPNRVQVISIMIAIVGAVLVVGEYALDSDLTTGFLIGILSAVLYAVVPILHQKNLHVPVNVRTLAQYLFALPLFLCFLPWANWDLKPLDWAGILHLSIVTTFIAHTLWIRATSELPTYMSGILFYLYVPIAMVLCHFVLGEQITPLRISGAVLIVLASVLGMWSQDKKKASGSNDNSTDAG